MEDWIEELLRGLGEDARHGRRALLRSLHAGGVPVEELRAAVREDRLALLPIERALLAEPRYTLAEVAARSGLDRDAVEAQLRAMGLNVPEDPDVHAYGDDDVEAARRSRRYLEAGVSPEEVRTVTRVMSGSLARTAEAVQRLGAETYLRPGDTEEDVADRYVAMAEALLPLVAADLEHLLRLHLRDLARHEALGAAERRNGRLADSTEVSVAFADIVGFTALGQEVPERELTDIAERLERLAVDQVRSPVRLVKSIGDAVMLVAPEPRPLLDAVLDLVTAAGATSGFPPLRAGMAHGRAVARLGDWFGPTVNLASRVTGRARPDSVLVTNEVRTALGEGAGRYAFSEAGFKHLKGYARPVPVLRVRRSSEPAG